VFASIRTSCMTNKVRKIWDLGQRLNEVANLIAWLIGLAAASITLRCGMALVRLRQFLFEPTDRHAGEVRLGSSVSV
jgi:hypothetical protein